MRIKVHASGFEPTAHVRGFVESRVLSALGSFADHVISAHVYVEARQRRTHPLADVCTIVVRLHPQGEVHVRAESVRMNTAIDRACSEIRPQVERVVSQRRREAVPPPAATHEQHDRALEITWNENRMSPEREPLETPDYPVQSVLGREYWKPSGGECEELLVDRPPGRDTQSKPHGREESTPGSRVVL